MIATTFATRRSLLLLSTLAIASCAGPAPYTLELMPAPAVLENLAQSVEHRPREITDGGLRVLFATDRAPAETPGEHSGFTTGRGHVVRLGQAMVRLHPDDLDWNELDKVSLLGPDGSDLKIEVGEVELFGLLGSSLNRFSRPYFAHAVDSAADDRFVRAIEEMFEEGGTRRVRIYVHGFRSGFENPLLVSAELARFLRYDGTMIAYSWPARTEHFGYFGDVETTRASTFLFRTFLEFLVDRVDLHKIDIVGFSAGTRLVAAAMHQISLKYDGHPDRDRIAARFGNIILVGSDLDQQVFGGYLADGVLDFSDQYSIYLSQSDRALSISRFTLGRERLGQQIDSATLHPEVLADLLGDSRLAFIDVTGLPGTREDQGHAYLRKSPDVSNDIVLTLLQSRPPDERGLIRVAGDVLWRFPENYRAKRQALLVD